MQTILSPGNTAVGQLGHSTQTMKSDREAFSDPTVPLNRWRPLADPSSDSDRAAPRHNRRQTRKAAIIVCPILVIGILESKRRRKQLYLTRELLAPPGSGTVWDRLREVQDRQDDAFILTMGIDVHSFAYLLDNGFSEQWNGATIDRNDVNSGATGGRSRPERRSLDAAGSLAQKNTYADRVLLLEEQNKKLQRTNLPVSLLERLERIGELELRIGRRE